MSEVFYTLDEEIQVRGYNVLSFGYDPYNSEKFVELYKQHNGPYAVEPVRQGARTESVPLGEIKALTEDRYLLFHEQIFSHAMGNTMVLEDTNGNRKIYKRRYENKIDPVAALLDAYVSYTRYLELYQ
jgi:phage terminase large subunit-like protein